MGRTRRRKQHTHVTPAESTPAASGIPQSIVMRRGKVGRLLQALEKDLRNLMMPHTAAHLKESKHNSLRDFVHVAGPLGVTHFLLLSSTAQAPYLRVAKAPRGPTLTFRIHSYSLAADLAATLPRYRAPPTIFQTPPLVVMNNFASGESHLKLATILFQNMFPPINVQEAKLSDCRRVLLLNYDPDTRRIDLRHYTISAAPTGVARPIRKLLQRKGALPDLGRMEDVAEYIERSGYGSESEAEDEAAKVTLPQDLGRANRAAHRSAVRLHEVGPRMDLQLIKVEEGLCTGKVLFHEYIQKTPEEIAALEARVKTKEELRAQRRAEQEANVKRKQRVMEGGADPAGARGSKKVQSRGKGEEQREGGREHRWAEREAEDRAWYREEVGEEPEEGLMRSRPVVNRDTKVAKFQWWKKKGRSPDPDSPASGIREERKRHRGQGPSHRRGAGEDSAETKPVRNMLGDTNTRGKKRKGLG